MPKIRIIRVIRGCKGVVAIVNRTVPHDIVVQKSFVQSSKKGLDTNLREETEKQEGEKVHKQKRCPREK